MSIRTANFYVMRNGQKFRCPGKELETLLQRGDMLAVQRDDTIHSLYVHRVDGIPLEFTNLRDDDLLFCTDVNNVTYRVTGLQFKTVVTPPPPLQITVPHVVEPIGNNTYKVTQESTVTGGVPPYTREYFWEPFGRADSEIPVLGAGDGEDRVSGSQPDRPYFSRTSGRDCLVAFSKATQKSGAYLYNTLEEIDWRYLEKIGGINIKGGKYFDKKYWCCTAGDGAPGVNIVTLNPDTGAYTIEHKNLATIAGGGVTGSVFNVDFNTETGTAIFVGYEAIFRSNYLSDPDITQVEKIVNTNFKYIRPIVCDPNTNEWWIGNQEGGVFYSADDGAPGSWSKIQGLNYKGSGSNIDAGDFWLDKDYIYYNVTSRKNSGKFLEGKSSHNNPR